MVTHRARKGERDVFKPELGLLNIFRPSLSEFVPKSHLVPLRYVVSSVLNGTCVRAVLHVQKTRHKCPIRLTNWYQLKSHSAFFKHSESDILNI